MTRDEALAQVEREHDEAQARWQEVAQQYCSEAVGDEAPALHDALTEAQVAYDQAVLNRRVARLLAQPALGRLVVEPLLEAMGVMFVPDEALWGAPVAQTALETAASELIEALDRHGKPGIKAGWLDWWDMCVEPHIDCLRELVEGARGRRSATGATDGPGCGARPMGSAAGSAGGGTGVPPVTVDGTGDHRRDACATGRRP